MSSERKQFPVCMRTQLCSFVRTLALAVLIILSRAVTASAQFFTPLPSPLTGDSVLIDEYRQALVGATRHDASVARRLADSASRDTILTAICASLKGDTEKCISMLTHDKAALQGNHFKPVHISYLSFGLPGSHDAEEVREYLRAAGDSGNLSLFSQFSANVSDKTAYVATDVISGMIGRVLVGIQYAAVVAKDSAKSDTARNTIEDGSASLLRIINAGGTVSGRVVLPIWAASGVTAQKTASIAATAGMVGPVSNSDSLRFATTLAGTLMLGLPIRDSDPVRTVLGELVFGFHVGGGWSESRLLASEPGELVGYYQIAFGLRKGSDSKLGISVLYTGVKGGRGAFRQLVPKLIVNFAAIR